MTFFVVVGMLGGYFKIVACSMPVLLAFLLASELTSGVALDPYWQAKHRKGCWQYKATIAWHAVGFVLLSISAIFFTFFFPPIG